MSDAKQWVTHFRNMSENRLPPGSIHVVMKRGGGPSKMYYRVQPGPIISPAQQTVDQARAMVQKAVNKNQGDHHTSVKRKVKPKLGSKKSKVKKPKKSKVKRSPKKKSSDFLS